MHRARLVFWIPSVLIALFVSAATALASDGAEVTRTDLCSIYACDSGSLTLLEVSTPVHYLRVQIGRDVDAPGVRLNVDSGLGVVLFDNATGDTIVHVLNLDDFSVTDVTCADGILVENGAGQATPDDLFNESFGSSCQNNTRPGPA